MSDHHDTERGMDQLLSGLIQVAVFIQKISWVVLTTEKMRLNLSTHALWDYSSRCYSQTEGI